MCCVRAYVHDVLPVYMCVFYICGMCLVYKCTCVCAQRLPSCYVCFTVGQPFTGRALWYVFRAISEQIYWLIIVKQVQGNGEIYEQYIRVTYSVCGVWRLTARLMCVTNRSTHIELSKSQTEETFSHSGLCQRNHTINEEHLSHAKVIVNRLKMRTKWEN